jgi:hypothetical protein
MTDVNITLTLAPVSEKHIVIRKAKSGRPPTKR